MSLLKARTALFYASLVFIILFFAEYLAIIALNHGFFTFTLDDPYIHLALAENILHGHYGVNSQEFSAPSSSILWPFLIAPLSYFKQAASLLLLLNGVLALISLRLLDACLTQMEQFSQKTLSFAARLWLLLAFLMVGNLIGLAFVGMEHSLQITLSVLILLGLLQCLNQQPATKGFYLAIIILPLVRYESATLSAAALLFLFVQRRYWQSVALGLLIVACVAAFSLFLLALHLDYLPASVLQKSAIAASGVGRLWLNFSENLTKLSPPMPKGLALFLIAAYLFFQAYWQQHRGLKTLLACVGMALLLHLFLGRIGWFWRYAVYVWLAAFVCLVLLQLYQHKKSQQWALALMLLVSLEHLLALALTPLAANNIYLQQYQMHRLVVDYYKKPVAVNDLGWVSYQNPDYVLDLWGLASNEARLLRQQNDGVKWMDQLAKQHHVELIMIYHNPLWFKQVPDNWIELGQLDYHRAKIVSWFPVSFYTPCAQCVTDLKNLLKQFAKSLPKAAILTVQ